MKRRGSIPNLGRTRRNYLLSQTRQPDGVSCPSCGQIFKNERGLRTHRSKVHKHAGSHV